MPNNKIWKKALVVGIIVLFIGMSITPSTGNIIVFDDTTPPVTTISLYPSEPGGWNGWYTILIEVTLEAIDDISGVNVSYYRINNGSWIVYEDSFRLYESNYYFIEFYSVVNAGNEEDVKNESCKLDNEPPITTAILDPSEPDGDNGWYVSDVTVTFNATDDMSGVAITFPGEVVILTEDCPFVEIYSIDNAGNEENHGFLQLPIDQTIPDIDLVYEYTGSRGGGVLEFTVTADDALSGMDRVEFYLNDILQDTIVGHGPVYKWSWLYTGPTVIKAEAFDQAGNMAWDEIKNPKVSRNSIQQSTHPLFLRFLERFQLLERFPLLERLLNLI